MIIFTVIGMAFVAWCAFGLAVFISIPKDIPRDVPWGIRILSALHGSLILPYLVLTVGMPSSSAIIPDDCQCPNCKKRRGEI